MDKVIIYRLLLLSGIGHFVLCAASLAIPKVLDWKTHLSSLQPLLRQMFWTYAAYILVINFGFGFISFFGTDELLNGSFLARCVTLFIAIYWLTRIIIQFFYFDRSNAPTGWIYTLGEIALVGLFAAFTVIYLVAFFFNFS